ncbi:M48 family metallopeptidase [Asticcacaulis sp. SL142]|uniref:M48 family metallopeptidase n=1 Tax=Asticcacaulis sp. SL142 TaxID=2995155 RepID=UPI00226CBD1F|nr:M48 family metallopeptidase [Asticcacaulis sp. SL142]WAC48475.1 M48 family metallopeptidase [Asticcacaulis sp. SL142]
MNSKHIFAGIAALALASVAACTTNETLGRSQLLLVDNAQLAEPAMAAWQETLKTSKISNDAEMNRRVKTVGARIVQAAGLSGQAWEYVVFDNPQPNAFVIPGNKVGVNSGLFKVVKNDDQLAAVLGHETGHNIAQHAAERYSQQVATSVGIQVAAGATSGRTQQVISSYGGIGAQLGVILPFSRQHELEADKIGVDLMAKAGYKPSESIALWRNMAAQRTGGAQPQFLSTHPSDDTRISQLQAYIKSKGYS